MDDAIEAVKAALWSKSGINFSREVAERLASIAIAAHVAALEKAGMVIVPREPTDTMIGAGKALGDDYHYDSPEKVWPAMLAAAPKREAD